MAGHFQVHPPMTLTDSSDEQPPRRISTPAGERLSTIMEGGLNGDRHSKRVSRISTHRTSAAALGLPPRESVEQSYTTIWSDANLPGQDPEKINQVNRRWRDNNFFVRRGGWKRLLLLLLIIVIIIIGVVVGLVFGLRSHHSKKSDTLGTQTSNPDTSPSSSPKSSSTSGIDPTPSHTVSSGPSGSAMPTDFPIGTYSMITFLNTVETNCTGNPDTWTCSPYTTYGQDPTNSMTSFNWNISAGSFPDTYQISSVDDPFAISFTSDLNLIDKGEDSEHYRFQITFDKKVIPSTSLTDDDSSTVCFYNSTTFQSYIYTKMSQDYPPSDMKTTNASYAPWPYAVRVEEVAGGGDSVPNCYKANNGVIGERVKSDSLKAQDAGALCDCLYMNWIP